MHKNYTHHRIIAFGFGIVALVWAALACADPSARVARLAYTSGAVSFSPAGEDVWVQATRNRPLITGDHLWADADARAELQIGSAAIRLNGSTSATLLNLDDSVAQLQLAQGTLNIRVQRLEPDDVFEIDTPNLAFSIREPGDYRIDVDADGNSTAVTVRNGRGEVYGEGTAYTIYARQSYRFFGTDLRDYDRYDALPPPDEFDHWSNDRDRRGDNSMSAHYVSRDVIGYEDLDEYGSWRSDPSYGHVWVPSHVSAGWAPYNDGHWVWVNPWGWTWVDDAPWGFTVSHYGRWAHIRGDWSWVPGPIAVRPVYAPALVAFVVGSNNFQLSVSIGNGGGVAWFPLAPREVYRPAYPVSRNYFTKINTSNTVVNNVNITNVYNNTNVTNITYANRQVPGAVVAVPAAAFARSQPVAQARIAVSKEAIKTAPVSVVAPVAPVHESVRGAAPQEHKPPAMAMERTVIAKTTPPPKPASFAAQQSALAAHPGKPLDEATLATVKSAAPETVVPVKVVAPSHAKDAGDKSQAGPAAPPERKGQSESRKQRGQNAEPKTIAPPSAANPADAIKPAEPTPVMPTPVIPTAVEPDHTPAVRPPVDRKIKDASPPPDTGNAVPKPETVKAAGPKTKAQLKREEALKKQEIKQAPPPQTGRPESGLRNQRGQIAEPKTITPPDATRPVEPTTASPAATEPDRTPVARPPANRNIKNVPPPSQPGRPAKRQPVNAVNPAEPAPAAKEPDRTPVARPPVNRNIKNAPPPQPDTGGATPKPDTVNSEVQKTKEQLKREEELRKSQMEDKGVTQ